VRCGVLIGRPQFKALQSDDAASLRDWIQRHWPEYGELQQAMRSACNAAIAEAVAAGADHEAAADEQPADVWAWAASLSGHDLDHYSGRQHGILAGFGAAAARYQRCCVRDMQLRTEAADKNKTYANSGVLMVHRRRRGEDVVKVGKLLDIASIQVRRCRFAVCKP